MKLQLLQSHLQDLLSHTTLQGAFKVKILILFMCISDTEIQGLMESLKGLERISEWVRASKAKTGPAKEKPQCHYQLRRWLKQGCSKALASLITTGNHFRRLNLLKSGPELKSLKPVKWHLPTTEGSALLMHPERGMKSA